MDEKQENYVTVMTSYRETIKSIVQLSVASLVLPVTFIRDILGIKSNEPIIEHIHWLLILSWVFLLISLGTGLYYQLVAAKRIEIKIWREEYSIKYYPRLAYKVAVVAFYLGIVAFLSGVSVAI